MLLLIQTCIIRYCIEFIWKSVRPIDDRFVMVCITVTNAFLSFLLAAMCVWDAKGMKMNWWLTDHHPSITTIIHDDHPLRYVLNANYSSYILTIEKYL